MKRKTLARILFLLGAPLFCITLTLFCVHAIRARLWKVLIMGISPTLALLIWFIGFWVTVRRGEPISEDEAVIALSLFLVIVSMVLIFVTHLLETVTRF